MSRTCTKTYVTMELSPAAYAEIRAKLVAAQYEHLFLTTADNPYLIAMDGLAVAPAPPPRTYKRGNVVEVKHPRYHGYGIVANGQVTSPGEIAVELGNGNTWLYEMDAVELVTDWRGLPRSIRRQKLQFHGYQCLHL